MNNVLLSDSYKYSHYNQYPENTTHVFSYLESRGGVYDEIVFFGLQYYLKEYISKPITEKDIREAEELALFHGIPFYKEGWNHIVTRCGGYLPLEIRAVPEGSINKPGDVLMTITNTDPKCWWLTNWVETLLMKVWYPTTIATKSYKVKKLLKSYWDETVDDDLHGAIDFAYHNFGDRGSSSVESALVGGMAHLTQFKGTDNFNAVKGCKTYYQQERGHSIPASEHSTVTAWGEDSEYTMFDSYLEQHKGEAIIACVSDSYDIFKATDYWTQPSVKVRVESGDYPTVVIRPDSGNPIDVINKMLSIMERNAVKYTINKKGFKTFDKYRILWGDGITANTIYAILSFLSSEGYSAMNMAFGSGGDLMQNINRDNCKFAIKCSAAKVNGVWRDVYKNPITDAGKVSKAGLLDSPNLQTVYQKFAINGWDTMSNIVDRGEKELYKVDKPTYGSAKFG